MERTEIIVNKKRINLYGSKAIIEKEKPIIEKLELTGIEDKDRLIIQNCIDENKLKSDILYEGNTVYPFEKIVKEYRRLQRDYSLEKLSNDMYHFFMNACGDIAHYDKMGYRCYYNDSIVELENRFLKNSYTASRYSDVDRIFKELKISNYFEEREQIDLDKITLNKLKSIIKDCGWNVVNKNGIWKIERTTMYGKDFSFEVDTSDNSVSNVVKEIQRYYNSFNKDEYVENIVAIRSSLGLTIGEIVSSSENIKRMLNNLSFDILYKSRLAVEESKNTIEKVTEISNKIVQDNLEIEDDFEYDYA